MSYLQNAHIVVLIMTSSKQEAEKIVQQLLREKLIACANIVGPAFSLFRWSSKIEKAEEYLVLMKSRIDLFEKLEENVKALHSYEVPEIIALPIVEGSKSYMVWLESCLNNEE